MCPYFLSSSSLYVVSVLLWAMYVTFAESVPDLQCQIIGDVVLGKGARIECTGDFSGAFVFRKPPNNAVIDCASQTNCIPLDKGYMMDLFDKSDFTANFVIFAVNDTDIGVWKIQDSNEDINKAFTNVTLNFTESVEQCHITEKPKADDCLEIPANCLCNNTCKEELRKYLNCAQSTTEPSTTSTTSLQPSTTSSTDPEPSPTPPTNPEPFTTSTTGPKTSSRSDTITGSEVVIIAGSAVPAFLLVLVLFAVCVSVVIRKRRESSSPQQTATTSQAESNDDQNANNEEPLSLENL